MEERRIHQRLNLLERLVSDHLKSHIQLEQSLTENTKLTQEIANNTSEMVALIKGIKGFRSLLIWGAPIVAAAAALFAFFKD